MPVALKPKGEPRVVDGGQRKTEERMATSKDRLQAKIERIHAARIKVEAFVAAGGDLKSEEAGPIGLELSEGVNELLMEFGSSIQEHTK